MDEKTENKQGIRLPKGLFNQAWDSLLSIEKIFYFLLIYVVQDKGLSGTISFDNEFFDQKALEMMQRFQGMGLLRYKVNDAKGIIWIKILKWSEFKLTRIKK